MGSRLRRWGLLFILVTGVFAIDQWTKRLIIESMQVGETQRIVPALTPFFQITRSENRGAAFGFLPAAGDFFLILAVIIVIGLIWFYPRLPARARLSQIAFGLVTGGALGNAADRLTYGAVVDFIHYTIPGVISNVSNIADHAIVLGVILLLIESWRGDRPRVSKAAVVERADEA